MIYQVVIISIAVVVLVLAGFIFSLRKKMADSSREDLEKKDDRIVSNLTNQIQLLSQTLGTIQKSVDQRLGENTSRLDNASKSYAEVKTQLAKLEEQTQKVYEASKKISF